MTEVRDDANVSARKEEKMSQDGVKVARLPEEKEVPVNCIGSMEIRNVRYVDTQSMKMNTKRECFLDANWPTKTRQEFNTEVGSGGGRKIRFQGEWLIVRFTKKGLEVEIQGEHHGDYIRVDPELCLETATSKGFLPVVRITRAEIDKDVYCEP